jgi:hypothetical protein
MDDLPGTFRCALAIPGALYRSLLTSGSSPIAVRPLRRHRFGLALAMTVSAVGYVIAWNVAR